MKKKLVLLLCLILVVGTLSACGGGDSGSAEGGSDGKSLNMAIDVFPETMHPHDFSTIVQYAIDFNIYEPLVYVTDSKEKICMMAESYEVSEDGKTYTYHIRPGVKFHNGDEMTVDDVMFSLESALEDPYLATYVSPIDNVEKIDENTVAVNLKEPSASFEMTFKYVTILNKKFTEENEGLTEVECGTGPYYMSDYQNGVKIELSAFEDYWQGPADIQTVTYNYISDPATRMLSFESGTLDYVEVPTADWERVTGSGDYNSGLAETDHVFWVTLNSAVEPFNNETLRQAIACAINKDNVITQAADGVYEKASVIARPDVVADATGDVEVFDYDVDKAKELLKEAGYEDGADLGEIIYIGGDITEKVATVIKSDLEAAGIKVEMKAVDDSAFYGELFAGNYTMGVASSAFGRDYSLYGQFYTSENLDGIDIARVEVPEIDEAFHKAAITVDDADRQAQVKDLITRLEKACYYIPLFYQDITWASNKAFTPSFDDNGVYVYDSHWE